MSSTDAPAPAVPARRRGPGRPRAGSEDKRERILNEAVALFGARGYAGTSLADIAHAADISKAGLLHHFSSKDALFAKVLERRDLEDQDIRARHQREAPGSDEAGGLDPWEELERHLELLERNVQHRELVAIYTATSVSVLDAQHPAHQWMAGHLDQAVERFEAGFEAGKRAGVVDPAMPSRLVARTLVAISDGLQLQWLCGTTPNSAASERLATGVIEEVRLYVDCLKNQWGRSSRPDQTAASAS